MVFSQANGIISSNRYYAKIDISSSGPEVVCRHDATDDAAAVYVIMYVLAKADYAFGISRETVSGS